MYLILFFEKKKSIDASTQTSCVNDCCVKPACEQKQSLTSDQTDDPCTQTDDQSTQTDDQSTQTDSQDGFEANSKADSQTDSIIGSTKTVKRRLIQLFRLTPTAMIK